MTTPTLDVDVKYLTTSVTQARRSTGTTNVDLGNRILEHVDVVFAPGHAALTGVRINYNGITLVPWNQSTLWIAGNAERVPLDLGIEVSARLQLVTFNNDTVSHGFQVVWRVREVPADYYRPALRALPIVTS